MSSISISFDPSHNPEMPTMVLMKKSGEMFGQLDAKSVVVKDKFVNAPEITFVVKKFVDGEVTPLWDKITNFKLIYCVEWNTVFEIKIDVNETNEVTKTVYGTELAQSELSQIILFNNEFNTETDIAREDYINPTVLYKPNIPSESLLNRMLEKAPHYNIIHVDDSIKNIQKTFSFNNVSLFDAFNQVAQEIDCVFVYNSRLNSNGDIIRGISVYDLETVCNNCGHRGDYIDTCPKCNSTNLTNGYGDDTTIFITADKLASDIQLSTDVGAIKNCFKLEAGDDLMTATIRNCNPDGSDYIWYISDKLKEDMSDELIEKLNNYNVFYDYYQNSYNPFVIDTSGLNNTDAEKVYSQLASNSSLITSYNNLISKYNTYTSDYHTISSPIIGYSELMKIYYDTISFYYYLNDSLMPTVTMSETNAQTEANKLNNQNLKNTAVQNLSSTTSVATVSSALLAMAKVLVDTNYQIKIVDEESTFTYSQSQSKWKGKFVVTNYSDESDTYTTAFQTIDISSDYATFIKQKLDVALAKTKTDTIASINDLFALNDTNFKEELKKYSLQRLKTFYDACQSCLDVLQQQGIANDRNEDNDEPTSMHSTIYLPYYNKLSFIQSEIDIRQSELDIVKGKFDENGGVLKQGMQTVLQKEIDIIQNNLNLQEYLGNNLWLELLTYRREGMYSNDNYISDGLNNAELFDKATEFIQTAKTEIKKSATLQHTITTTLKNLLVMKEFSSIVNYFKVGNWLRIQIDDVIYKLRLVDYEIDFDNLENINITFSDVTVDNSGASSIKDVLSQASNMTTTYNIVTRQAKKGSESANVLDNWVDNGLMTTKTKIVDSADNQDIVWDKHGLLCREYDSVTDTYSDKQLKLINKGLYLTDNNWRTAKAGIGNFVFFNPSANGGEGEYQEAYGVIADTLVGNLILGRSVGIYNTKNSLTMDEDGFVLTTNGTDNNETQSVFTIRRKTVSNGVKLFKDMFYIDSNGYVTINGGVKIDVDGESDNLTMVEMVDGKITTHITDELANGGLIKSSISQMASQIQSTVSAIYETKTDSNNKKTALESSINQTASNIASTVKATSGWDIASLDYTINIIGTADRGNDHSSIDGYAAADYVGKFYLDDLTGHVYESKLESGSNTKYVWYWKANLTRADSSIYSRIDQTANSIISTVSATYETKEDASAKKTSLEASISQSAGEVKLTVSKSTSKYDTTGYTITISGYGMPTTSPNSFAASNYNGKYYLDQNNGKLYLSNGSSWSNVKTLNLITDNLSSKISQTAGEIRSEVSSTYETKTDSNNKKTALESSINQTASNIASTVKATSGWDIASLDYTINIIGTADRGNDHSSIDGYAAADYVGKFYLDDLTGHVYESKLESGSNTKYVWYWKANLTRADSSIYSRIDQTANSIISTVSATYETKEDATSKKEVLESTISQTADQIKLNVSSSLSQYDLSSFSGVISVFGYGIPTASKPSASIYKNQYYLNQSNGQVYKSNGSSWSTYGSPLNVINGSWQSQITANANAITSKVGSADVHTIIQQTPEDVRIAWNGISNYISFENAAIKIKNSSNNLLMQLNNNGMNLYDSNSMLLSKLDSSGVTLYESDGNSGNRPTMRLNRNGANYYYQNTYLGKIGTNTLGTDINGNSVCGLVFDLDENGKYMTWAARTNNSSGYSIKLTYFQNDITMGSTTYKQGFRVSSNIYFYGTANFNSDVSFNNHKLYLDSNSYIGTARTGVLDIVGRTDKALTLTGYGGKYISIGNGGVDINTDLVVTGTVTSSSDARLKTKINDSKVNVLPLLSNIELKEFDWMTDKSHSSVGIIAQQLQEVIPELVHENFETGMLSIKVDRFIPFIIKAIQELYVLCSGKKLRGNSKWIDTISDKDKRIFMSLLLDNKLQSVEWESLSEQKGEKEEIFLLNK